MKITLATVFPALVAAALALGTPTPSPAETNPPAEGFRAEESDAEAIALADRVMERLGGREAWDATRFVSWKFFGNRFHAWDKHSGDIRVEGTDRETKEPYTILMNLGTKAGRAWQSGAEVTDPEALSALLELGESAWINDSYWMFMPYKLKDSGVRLRYLGERDLLDGRPAEVVELTFREVGRTPENRYEVYVAADTGLVEQWDFFANASDESPRFQTPWRNWRRHGGILLSDDRGRSGHTDITVFDELPPEVFSSPEAIDLSSAVPAPAGRVVEVPIHAVEGDVAKPRLIDSSQPAYPESARKERITGKVGVRTVIDQNGFVRDAFISDSVEESLDRAALEAVREWRFEPATLNADPVAVYYTITVNFELERDPKLPEDGE